MGRPGSEAVSELRSFYVSGKPLDLESVQQALRESDEWWQAIFEVAGIGILFGDTTGEILVTSPKLQEMFGYTDEEIRALGVPGLTHPEDLQTDFELFMELVQGKRDHYQLEKRYLRKDQTIMWGLLTVLLLRDSADEPRFGIAMIEDITETKKVAEYESRLQQAAAARHQALELHDTVLQGLVVAKLAFETEDHERARTALEASVGALKTLIDSLLADSRAAGTLDPGSFVRTTRTPSYFGVGDQQGDDLGADQGAGAQ